MAILLMALFTLSAFATDAEMYLASDKNGQNRVTMIQEGDEVWIAVYDPDEDIDCDVRDKIWTDVKVFDPKTGAYIVWVSYMDAAGDANGNDYNAPAYVPFKGHFPGGPVGWLGADYLEETGANTGLFGEGYEVGLTVTETSRRDCLVVRRQAQAQCLNHLTTDHLHRLQQRWRSRCSPSPLIRLSRLIHLMVKSPP